MPRRRPTTLTFSTSFLSLLILLPIIAAAPQQQQQQHGVDAPIVQTISAERVNEHRKTPLGIPSKNKRNSIVAAQYQHERALATVSAPVAPSVAVRAPSSPASPSSGVLSPRNSIARSLQDWEVEDFVLLATVNGQIHARDRYTGRERWTFDVGRSMVETYHKKRILTPEDTLEELEKDGTEEESPYIWIIEPTQDGNLYVYSEGPNPVMHKINMTVKQLAEEFSPWQNEGPPAVVYTASKKTHLYTLNARTGKIIRRFSSGGSTIYNDTSCERTTGFESSNQECQGTLTLGQTEYEVEITDLHTGEVQCVLKYFEWTPNKRDSDLHSQYQSTMDNKYVLSKYDGSFDAIDRKLDPNLRRPLYSKKLDSPVARVYDVARPYDDQSGDAPLIILPQPLVDHSEAENDVWVNCTETGSWYAMSELHYPSVTDRAPSARCYSQQPIEQLPDAPWEEDPATFPKPSALVGVHSLSRNMNGGPFKTLPAPSENVKYIDQPPVSATPVDHAPHPGLGDGNRQQGVPWQSVTTGLAFPLLLIILSWLLFSDKLSAVARKLQGKSENALATSFKAVHVDNTIHDSLTPEGMISDNINSENMSSVHLNPNIASDNMIPVDITSIVHTQPSQHDEGDKKQVHFDIISDEATKAPIVGLPRQTDEAQISPTSSNENTPEEPEFINSTNGDQESKIEGDEETEEAVPKKKKAHRGKRGGRKLKKKMANTDERESDETTQIIEQAKNLQQPIGLQPDESTVASSMTDVNDPIIKVGKITVDKGKILGAGSGGTIVFEGKWNANVVVAVKRTMPQNVDFANREIDYLQKSDLHPNVIRYFDDERDNNFLYIAIELCQASLWDLYKDYRSTEDPLTDAHTALKTQINLDVPGALKQIAKGLNHLHGLRIIHRDIKPHNILIAYPKPNDINGPLRLVISDFGLSKTLPDNASTLLGTEGNAGTIGWKAPELITTPKESDGTTSSALQSRESTSSNDPTAGGVKRAADIFSLGCVFYFVLTNGSHPFDDAEGWMQLRELNIKKNKQNLKALEDLGPGIEEAKDLLLWMLNQDPSLRLSATEVLQHPFFWDAQTRLGFLCDVSDHWEREERDPPSVDLMELESWAKDVISQIHPSKPVDFMSQLDKKFIDTLGKQRKYTGDRLLDLLRALRNKRNHYEDMGPEVQKMVGPLPKGYLDYWTRRFPKLLIQTFIVVQRCKLQDHPRFLPYFKDAPIA